MKMEGVRTFFIDLVFRHADTRLMLICNSDRVYSPFNASISSRFIYCFLFYLICFTLFILFYLILSYFILCYFMLFYLISFQGNTKIVGLYIFQKIHTLIRKCIPEPDFHRKLTLRSKGGYIPHIFQTPFVHTILGFGTIFKK